MNARRGDDLPRGMRALLQSLGARQALTEDVLGDLAEEYSERLREVGPMPARVWLYSQAARAAPHLVGDWARQFGRRDAGILALATIAALAAGRLFSAVLWIVLERVTFLSTGIGLGAYLHHWSSTGDMMSPVFIALAVGAVVPPVLGGFVAGVVGRGAPVAHALMAAIVLVISSLLALLMFAHASAGVTAAGIVRGVVGIALFIAGGALAGLWIHARTSAGRDGPLASGGF